MTQSPFFFLPGRVAYYSPVIHPEMKKRPPATHLGKRSIASHAQASGTKQRVDTGPGQSPGINPFRWAAGIQEEMDISRHGHTATVISP